MSDDLTKRYYAALATPGLMIQLDRNLFGGRPLLRLLGPGKTERSKPVALVPVIVGEEGETHADMLRHVATALEQQWGADIPEGD